MDSEQYAWLLMNSWGVGSAESNNGMLLLHVVMEDRGWLALGAGLTSRISTDDVNELLDEYFWPLSDAGEYDEAVAMLFPHLINIYEGIYGVELYGGSAQAGQDSGQGGSYYDEGYYDPYYRPRSPFKSIATIIIVILVLAVLCGGIGGGYYRRRRYGVSMFFFCGGRAARGRREAPVPRMGPASPALRRRRRRLPRRRLRRRRLRRRLPRRRLWRRRPCRRRRRTALKR